MLALIERGQTTIDRILLAWRRRWSTASLCWLPSVGDLTSVWQQLEVQLAALTAPWAFTVTVRRRPGLGSRHRHRMDGDLGRCGRSCGRDAPPDRGSVRPFRVAAAGASVTAVDRARRADVDDGDVPGARGPGRRTGGLGRALDHNVRVLLNAAAVSAISSVFVIARMIDAWTDDVPFTDDVGHALIVVAIAVRRLAVRRATIRQVGAGPCSG